MDSMPEDSWAFLLSIRPGGLGGRVGPWLRLRKRLEWTLHGAGTLPALFPSGNEADSPGDSQ